MTGSREYGDHQGLNVIAGDVVRFPVQNCEGLKFKVPQVGWNRILKPIIQGGEDPWRKTPLEDIHDGEYMYFVHSYYVKPEKTDNILTTTAYSVQYASSVVKGNVFGFQFHPEKSGKHGIEIYRNFKKLIEQRRNE
jgi:glutamine amidotransferase